MLFLRKSIVVSIALLLVFMPGCSDDEHGLGISALTEYQRVAIWANVLSEYPDLPEKVERIVEGQDKATRLEANLPSSEVILHTTEGAQSFYAQTIDVIVTDLDKRSLKKLLTFWRTIDSRVDNLGIKRAWSSRGGTGEPRVVFLGADGKIEIKGPGGESKQSIDIYQDSLTRLSTLQIHAFDGKEAVPSVVDYIRRNNPIRGPPHNITETGKTNMPPPSRLTIVAIGNLENLSVEGPREMGTQEIVIETNLTKEVTASEATKVGAVLVAAKSIRDGAVSRAKARQSASSRSSYTPSSGGGRGGGYRSRPPRFRPGR